MKYRKTKNAIANATVFALEYIESKEEERISNALALEARDADDRRVANAWWWEAYNKNRASFNGWLEIYKTFPYESPEWRRLDNMWADMKGSH